MIRSAWARLRDWIGGMRDEASGAGKESNPSAFSLLDASVNYSHGQSDGEAVRELQAASDHAEELTDARREQR